MANNDQDDVPHDNKDNNAGAIRYELLLGTTSDHDNWLVFWVWRDEILLVTTYDDKAGLMGSNFALIIFWTCILRL